MSGALHEVIGVFIAAIVAVTIVSVLSPNAKTNDVANTTFSGFNSMLGQISAPVK
jgi:hypothetical protein